MKNGSPFYLSILLVFLCSTLFAQRYSHNIHASLSEVDLRYMPLEELNILYNEIIALKGAQTNKQGTTNSNQPYSSFSGSHQFLNANDRANLDLIQQMKMENKSIPCTDKELYSVFSQLAKNQQEMPIYLAEKFYGIPLQPEMVAQQRVLPITEEIMAFWVPQFPEDCEVCPYLNHFVTINISSGEKIASLETEGLMTLLDDNILEVKNFTKGTTTQPEYYQIVENGQLISTESQMVQLQQDR